uniref:Uncharacterized protein n=1 Tax=Anguilla anguilla TaxID=7936 RepID=A0A0E9WF52_ANGAN
MYIVYVGFTLPGCVLINRYHYKVSKTWTCD